MLKTDPSRFESLQYLYPPGMRCVFWHSAAWEFCSGTIRCGLISSMGEKKTHVAFAGDGQVHVPRAASTSAHMRDLCFKRKKKEAAAKPRTNICILNKLLNILNVPGSFLETRTVAKCLEN